MEMTERKKKTLFNIRYMDVRYVMDVGESDRKKEFFTVEFFYIDIDVRRMKERVRDTINKLLLFNINS